MTTPCAIVTGAGRGIGAAVAARLRADGRAVTGLDRSSIPSDAHGAPTGSGGRASAGGADVDLVADISDVDAVARAVLARPDVSALVCVAGVWHHGSILDLPLDDLRRIVEVNLLGTLNCVRAWAPSLRRHRGSVVLVSSVTARVPTPGAGIYPATKAALEAITRQLALELGPDGVRVNAVAPGLIHTEGTDAQYGPGGTREAMGRHVPLRHIGTPEEIADVVSFLMSDSARYVTGTVIDVDGGFTAAATSWLGSAAARTKEPS